MTFLCKNAVVNINLRRFFVVFKNYLLSLQHYNKSVYDKRL